MMKDYIKQEILFEDKIAEDYNRWYHSTPIQKQQSLDFIQYLKKEIKKGDKVLDLGCGPASLWPELIKIKNIELTGADISPAMIKEAKKKFPDGDFVIADSEKLPFIDGEFDVVICSSTLHHLPEIDKSLTEIKRVLKKSGVLVGREPQIDQFIATAKPELGNKVMKLVNLIQKREKFIPIQEPPIHQYHHAFKMADFIKKLNHNLFVEDVISKFPLSNFFVNLKDGPASEIILKIDRFLENFKGNQLFYRAKKSVSPELAANVQQYLKEVESNSLLKEKKFEEIIDELSRKLIFLIPIKLENARILQLGNIANNAYLNSKSLREQGIASDVLCYDYYHIMGSPEWEDAEIQGDYGNDSNPDWTQVRLGGFKRPDWFYQGTPEKATEKILAKYSPGEALNNLPYFNRIIGSFIYFLFVLQNYCLKIKLLNFLGKPLLKLSNTLSIYNYWSKEQLFPREIREKRGRYFKSLIEDFRTYFPERKDKLSYQDILYFLYRADLFEQIFNHYDLIQAYACDPIYPLLANKHPYIAFEHGTLRDIPFENSPQGRLTALAYRKADLVMITNPDNIRAARNLRLSNFISIPHPVNDIWHRNFQNKPKKTSKKKILFCPTRHDWAFKNINYFIEALPTVRKNTKTPFKVVFVEWGNEIDRSKNLIRSLGVEEFSSWIRPLSKKDLAAKMEECDIVLDQAFWIGMGTITAEALLTGRPVLTSYDAKLCQWMFPDPPPIISVFSTDDVVWALTDLLNNPSKIIKIGLKGKEWFKKYHAKSIVVEKLKSSYNKVLRKK